ncbi:MAG: PDZ domain-containing protein [Bacteroidota bacterium]
MRRICPLLVVLLTVLVSAPDALAQDPPGLGFAFVPEAEGLRVTTLADDGPAGPAGLLVGDVVTAVSGKAMPGLEREAIAEWLAAVNGAGLPVTLDVARDGGVRKVEITPAPYSRVALQAKTEAEAVFDSLDTETFVDLLEALGSAFGSSPELEAFREAMDKPPYNRTVQREGDDLVIASTTCTVRITVSGGLVVTSTERGASFRVDGPGLWVKCSGDPYEPADVVLDVDTSSNRDRAVETLQALIRTWDAAPSASVPGPTDPAQTTGCIEGDCTDGTGTWRYASGATYAGTWREGTRHGEGTYTFANGMTFFGEWVDGARVQGRETYESGGTYDGEYANDKRHGTGTYTFPSGNVYTGAWMEGKRTGYGIMVYANDDTYAGNWHEGKRHGLGSYTWAETGMTFTGTWADGTRVQGRETFTDGRVYQGAYANDKRHGQGTMTYPDGRVETGTWREGAFVAVASQPSASQPAAVPASAPRRTDPADSAPTDVCTSGTCTDGTGTMRYASGQTFTGTFRDGRPVRGLFTIFNGDTYDGELNAEARFHGQALYTFGPGEYEGETFQGTFANGAPTSGTYTWADGQTYTGDWDGWVRTGQGVMKYVNGNVYDGGWRDGDRHGRGTFTWPSGATFTGDWVDNDRVRGRETYTSGNVYEGAYADDKRHGQGTMTYTSGTVYTGGWVAGERVGQGTFTWPSGATFTGTWVANSRTQGVHRYADGRVYEGAYKNDRPHGTGTMTHPGGRVERGEWEGGTFLGSAD